MRGEIPRKAGRADDGGNGDSPARERFVPLRAEGLFNRNALRGLGASFPVFGIPATASAQEAGGVLVSGASLGALEVIQFAVFTGVLSAALLSAIWLIRERAKTAAENLELRTRIAEIGNALQRSEALLNLKDQRVVAWMSEGEKPDLVGTLPPNLGVPEDRGGFLAYGRWLVPRSASAVEKAITALRDGAAPFDLTAETQNGSLIEVQGRRSAAHSIVRFRSLSEREIEHARLKLEHQRLIEEHETMLGLIEELDLPFWARGADGRLQWVNGAYARAVEAPNPASAITQNREFLGSQARETIDRHHRSEPVFQQTLSTVVGGDRRVFRVNSYRTEGGSAGVALDVSETEALREEYERTVRSHADTLDQLTTAVATFDSDQKLRFFNQAFQKLWSLDTGYLESAPENALLLDRLRSEGKLAEQPEWRRWKESLLSAYTALESKEHWWHLPDGRTIRVIANPQPKGGVTMVFENLTEKMDLESRYNTAVRVQGETLDNLAEGVAVFGPDGRLRLANPAFALLWELDTTLTATNTHISAIKRQCKTLTPDGPWADFVAAATGFDDERRDTHGQAELSNGTALRYAIIHLPNGQVMLTFVNVTDSVKVERALKEKNEALEKADQIKSDFVQHVSYELRSPLTNIIGFTELLALGEGGTLSEKQREYVDHIGSSSSVLLTVVNDILDLATVDAGIMELEVGEVGIRPAVDSAAQLIAERLKEHNITLAVDISKAPATFHADENRLRQVLFNLLSNAANFAPENSTVSLTCLLADDMVEFRVHDDGPGMPPEMIDSIFRRFEPRSNGGRRRGAGLGLSIVKSFVELHSGTVELQSAKDAGTTVICRFPVAPEGMRVAAE